MNHLLCILQPPEPESFSMVPLVWQENGALRVTGFSKDSTHRADSFVYGQAALDVLLASGSARSVPKMGVEMVADDFVGLWVGDAFRMTCCNVGLAAPEVGLLSVHDGSGSFRVESSVCALAKMGAWIEYVFGLFLRSDDARLRSQIADLMHRALPGDDRTLAALWAVSEDPDQEVHLQTSIFRRDFTAKAWKTALKAVIERRMNTMLT